MAKQRFPLDIDLMQNELQNSLFHKLSVPPSNPKIGQFYFDAEDLIPYYWNGLLWKDFGGSAASVQSVTSSDNHIVVDNTDPLNPILSFQLVDDENLLTDDELAIVQATSGTNTGDQFGDGVTITGAGTIADPFVAVGGSIRHNQLMWLSWLDSGHTGTSNKIAGFGASGEAVEYIRDSFATSSATSGTITLVENQSLTLTTTLTNAHTLTITPTVPTTFDPPRWQELLLTVGATLPAITWTTPSGVVYEFADKAFTVGLTANKKYMFLYKWISATRCIVSRKEY